MQGKRDVSTRTDHVGASKQTSGLLMYVDRRSVAATPTRTTGEEPIMATTGTDLTHAAAAFVDAFNRADWDTWGRLIADDVVYTEAGTGRRVEGADAFLELAKGWKAAFADVTGTVHNAIVSGDTVAQELRWDGTHTGPLQMGDATIEPTGRRFSIEASFWYRFDGDHPRELHHYADLLMLLQQLGAMPGPAQ
jgi:steroid delta-isomerase-like uncharacterized protein